MKKILLVLCVLLSLAGVAQTNSRVVRFFFDNQNSVNRQFPTLVHPPKAYERDSTTPGKYPLFVFAHGAGQGYTDAVAIDGRNLSKIYNNTGKAGGPSYFVERSWPDSFRVAGDGAWMHPFIASPQAPAWSANGDQLNYIIKGLVEKYPAIDRNRIYVTGLSAGGEASVNFVARTNGNNGGANTQFTVFYKAAAMLPMSQANAANSWKAGIAVSDSIPAWGFGSPLNDTHGSATRDQIAFMNAIKSNYARFTNYTTGHGDWDVFYDPSYHETIGGKSMNMYEWSLQFSRAVVTNPTVVFSPASLTLTLPADSIILTPATLTPGTGATFSGYAWTKTSGPGTPAIVTATASSSKVRGLQAGNYIYRLTATNNSAQTGFGEVAITVNDVNPSVTVSNATITLPTSSVSLTSTPVTNYTILSQNWIPLKRPGQAIFKLVVAGSSTALGSGLSNSANSYVNRYNTWASSLGLATVSNVAVAGTSVFDVNIPGLFTGSPQAVLLNYASNGYTVGEGKTITQIMQKLQQVKDSCTARGVLFYTTTCQPRDEYGLTDRTRLKTISDSTLLRFGAAAVMDVFTPFADPSDYTIKPQFKIAGDLIHMNDAFHLLFYEALRAKGIFRSLVTNSGTISAPTSQNTSITGLPAAGTYLYQQSLTDSRGYSATAVSTVTVNAAGNIAPVARAGNDTTITAPASTVVVSGSTSTDADGTIVSYRWTRIAGSTAYNFTDSTQATTNVNDLQPGSYTFRLTVTDNVGLTSTDDKAVTVLAAAGPSIRRILKGAPSEYVSFALMEDSLVYRYFFWTPTNKVEWRPFDLGGKKAKDIAVGFNRGLILDTEGYAYISASGSNTPFKVTTDTLGNPFNYNSKIYGYFYSYLTLTADGRIMYFGQDDYKLYSAGSINITRPIQLSPAGVQYKEVHVGKFIWAVTVGGVIHRFSKGGSRTPTVMALPGGVACATIAGSHNDFTIAVGMDGHPYAVGNDYQYWGGTSPAASFVSVKSIWKLPTGVKKINANHNIIALTDSLNHLWTLGDNAQGEKGNGIEFVNKKELTSLWYNWNWGKGVFGFDPVPYQVQFPIAGVEIEEIYMSDVFAFFAYYKDTQGRIWFIGRRKSFVGWDGLQTNPENFYPNSNDQTTPVEVRPWEATPAVSRTFIPAVLDAGSTVFTTDSVVTLSATGTPSTGFNFVARNWTIVAVTGDSLANANIESPSAQTTRITGLTKGAYRFNIQFIDNNGATLSDTVSVIVSQSAAVNQPPVVNAGSDSIVTLPRNFTTLNGSATDPDGEIQSYLWSKVSGPAATIVSDASPSTPVTGLTFGNYVFRLTARDTSGAATFDDVNVTVINGANPLPTVSIGIPSVVVLPTSSVTLVGSAVASGGTITGIQWANTVRPPGASAPTIAVQATTTVINDLSTPGLYTFRLQATDSNGGVSAATVNVTVNLPGNACPPQIIQFNGPVKIVL